MACSQDHSVQGHWKGIDPPCKLFMKPHMNHTFHVWIVRVYLALVSSIFLQTSHSSSKNCGNNVWMTTTKPNFPRPSCQVETGSELHDWTNLFNISRVSDSLNGKLWAACLMETCDIAAKLFFTTGKVEFNIYFQFCHDHSPPIPVSGFPFSFPESSFTSLSFANQIVPRSFSTFLVVFTCFCLLLPPPRPDHNHENDRDCNNDCNNFAGMGFEIEMLYF